MTADDKTIKDGVEIGFTFFQKDLEMFLDDFKSQDSGRNIVTQENGVLKTSVRLPKEEIFSGRFLGLDDVFRSATLEDAIMFDCGKNQDISTWEGYTDYIKNSYWYHMPKKVRYFRFSKTKQLESRFVDCEGLDYDETTKTET